MSEIGVRPRFLAVSPPTRPAKPQSYRDLGLALNADGEQQKAIDTLYEVIARPSQPLSRQFGMPEQQARLVTLRLSGSREVVFVGEFEVEAGTNN